MFDNYPNEFFPKPFTPLVHANIRYYFANIDKNVFGTKLSKSQFYAVKVALNHIPADSVEKIREYVGEKPEGKNDISDSYIFERVNQSGMTQDEKIQFYNDLKYLDRIIAVSLGYADTKYSRKQERIKRREEANSRFSLHHQATFSNGGCDQ